MFICSATTSYDNSVCLFDTRKPQAPVGQVDVGGGAWRVKWHPSPARRNDLLVACMHDGFKVVRFANFGGLTDESKTDCSYTVLRRYDEHSSLGYGVDWSYADSGKNEDTLIGSCSFYDHTLNLWRG